MIYKSDGRAKTLCRPPLHKESVMDLFDIMAFAVFAVLIAAAFVIIVGLERCPVRSLNSAIIRRPPRSTSPVGWGSPPSASCGPSHSWASSNHPRRPPKQPVPRRKPEWPPWKPPCTNSWQARRWSGDRFHHDRLHLAGGPAVQVPAPQAPPHPDRRRWPARRRPPDRRHIRRLDGVRPDLAAGRHYPACDSTRSLRQRTDSQDPRPGQPARETRRSASGN